MWSLMEELTVRYNEIKKLQIHLYVAWSAKRGIIAFPNCQV